MSIATTGSRRVPVPGRSVHHSRLTWHEPNGSALRDATAHARPLPPLLRMPVTHSLDRSVLTLHMLGTYSPAEIRAALVAALADERARGLAGLVFDLHESRSITTRTLGDMTANTGFLAYNAAALGNRIAFVLPQSIDDTLVRMASVDLGTAGVATEIFHDIEEAARWLRASASEDSSRR